MIPNFVELKEEEIKIDPKNEERDKFDSNSLNINLSLKWLLKNQFTYFYIINHLRLGSNINIYQEIQKYWIIYQIT